MTIRMDPKLQAMYDALVNAIARADSFDIPLYPEMQKKRDSAEHYKRMMHEAMLKGYESAAIVAYKRGIQDIEEVMALVQHYPVQPVNVPDVQTPLDPSGAPYVHPVYSGPSGDSGDRLTARPPFDPRIVPVVLFGLGAFLLYRFMRTKR